MSVSLWCEEVEEATGAQEVEEALEARSQSQGQGPHGGGKGDGVQLRAPWDPNVSGQRVIQRLLQVEERYLPSALYIALVQRDPERREELAKWAMEVCCECGLDETVFPLSISLLDRFLSTSLSLPVSPYCLTAACILISSKLSESENVTADTLCAAAEYNFLPSDLREMERVVLATLRWDTAAITPQDFLPHFLPPSERRTEDGGDEAHAREFLSTLRRHSDTLVAMCVCDSRFLGAPPSLVAAAALNSALRGLGDRKGPDQLTHMAATLAQLCQTDLAVLQCYSELIEGALKQRLRNGLQQDTSEEKDGGMEDERAGTPTDMRDIDF